jgi:hypothetical protein
MPQSNPVSLNETEQEFLAKELEAFAQHSSGPDSQDQLRALKEAVAQGRLPISLLEPLGPMLQLSLESGRLRNLYGPHAEMYGLRLFLRTPAGQALKSTADEVNQALAGLKGQTLGELNFTVRGPSAFDLWMDTDRCRIQIHINRAGIRVKNMEFEM